MQSFSLGFYATSCFKQIQHNISHMVQSNNLGFNITSCFNRLSMETKTEEILRFYTTIFKHIYHGISYSVKSVHVIPKDQA